MNHLRAMGVLLALFSLPISGCVQQARESSDSGWITLLDGTNLDHWTTVGKANWRVLDGVVQADQGNGYLVSKSTYTDFQIRAEFWVDTPANSGIFIRCIDAAKDQLMRSGYEVNINDARPEASLQHRRHRRIRQSVAAASRRPADAGIPSRSLRKVR